MTTTTLDDFASIEALVISELCQGASRGRYSFTAHGPWIPDNAGIEITVSPETMVSVTVHTPTRPSTIHVSTPPIGGTLPCPPPPLHERTHQHDNNSDHT